MKIQAQYQQRYQKTVAKEKGTSIWERDIRLGPAISLRERMRLYHMLAVLLKAGLPIVDAITVMTDQLKNAKMKTILDEIQEDLVQGKALAEALSRQAKYFSLFEQHSLRIGEATGRMNIILEQLASFYEKRIRLRRKVVQALTYPIAVIFVAIGVIGFMISTVVPMFQDVFNRFDAELPPITQMILGLAEGLQQYGMLGLGIMVLTGLLIFYIRTQSWAQRWGAWLMLRVPVFGPLMLKLQLARLCYTFSLLLFAQVQMDRALELLGQIISFYPLQQALFQIKEDVVQGITFYDAVRKHGIFPSLFVQIVKVGERTAQLDHMFEQLAKSLEEESEAGVQQLTQLLEPVLIVVLGASVGTILVAMYLPMFELGNAIG